MFLLDVPFQVTSETEALSTDITGMVASCHIHPPLEKAHEKAAIIKHLPFNSAFMNAKGFPCRNNSNLFHLFQHFFLERV